MSAVSQAAAAPDAGSRFAPRPGAAPARRMITAQALMETRQLLRNVETLYEKTRAGLTFLYQHRNDDLSTLFSRPALLGRAEKR